MRLRSTVKLRCNIQGSGTQCQGKVAYLVVPSTPTLINGNLKLKSTFRELWLFHKQLRCFAVSSLYIVCDVVMLLSLSRVFLVGGSTNDAFLLIVYIFARYGLALGLNKLLLVHVEQRELELKKLTITEYQRSEKFKFDDELNAFIRVNSEIYINNFVIPCLRVPIETFPLIISGAILLSQYFAVWELAWLMATLGMGATAYWCFLRPRQRLNGTKARRASEKMHSALDCYILNRDLYRFSSSVVELAPEKFLEVKVAKWLKDVQVSRWLQVIPRVTIDNLVFMIVGISLVLGSADKTDALSQVLVLLMLAVRALPVVGLLIVASSQIQYAKPYVGVVDRLELGGPLEK